MTTGIAFLDQLEEDLLEAAHAPSRARGVVRRARPPRRPWSMRLRAAVAGAAVLGLAALVGTAALQVPGDQGGEARRFAGRRTSERIATSSDVPVPMPSPASGNDAYVGYAPSTQDSVDTNSGTGAAVPLTGPRVVKTAHLALVTPRDGFSSAFQQASLVASRYGGFVQSSSTGGTESRRGSLLIRVPAASFEAALADLRGLGRIDREETAGEDVTARYVDLGSRLRAWEAEEAALIALLRKATTVDATLRVRRELQEVQGNIEQLKGQLRLIEDQTDLASIAVDLREAGLPAVQAKAEADGPSFTSAWKATRDGFLGVIFTMLVGLGYLVPIGIVVMALALLWRWTRPHRLRRVGAGGFEPPTSAL